MINKRLCRLHSLLLLLVVLFSSSALESFAQDAKSKKVILIETCDTAPSKSESRAGEKSSPPKSKDVGQPGETISKSWLNSSLDELNNSFTTYSSTGGKDFYDEVPREMLRFYSARQNGWSMRFGTYPEGVPYPSWSDWHSGLHSALFQLRWELLTDPEQKVRKLGKYFTYAPEAGSPLWHLDNSTRHGVSVYDARGGSCWEPGLSQTAHFQGKARVLLEVRKDRHVTAKVLDSTLPAAVTARLKESMESLDGHPVVAFPASGQQFERVSVIYDFSFSEPAWLGLPKKDPA